MIDRILMIVNRGPEDGIKILDSDKFNELTLDINSNTIILNVNKENILRLKSIIEEVYGGDYDVTIINNLGSNDEANSTVALEKIEDSLLESKNIVFLPKIDKKLKSSYDFSDIMGIMKVLRGDGGCPWDRKQDHKSIRQSLIEEAYEVVDAIDKDDSEAIKEELGDLLLQVVFHSQIAYENKDFIPLDVTSALANKLIYRHPHIFSEKDVENTEEVVYNWNKLKYANRQITTLSDKLKDIPKLPALMYSFKAQERAAEIGFDWNEVSYALDKVYEELEELVEVMNVDSDRTEEELGDLLFSIVNVSRFLNINPEVALNRTINKFISRLKCMEERAHASGRQLEEMTLEDMDSLWDQVKIDE